MDHRLVIEKSQGGKLGRTRSGKHIAACYVPVWPVLHWLSYKASVHLPRDGSARSGLDLLTLVSNQDNFLLACAQAPLISEVLQFLPRNVWWTIEANQHKKKPKGQLEKGKLVFLD